MIAKFSRRQFLHLAASAVALPAISGIAQAQTYPSRPVRLIVPFAAGGGTDITARVIAQWLSERLGQQFVIDNRPGGGTNIGTEAAAKASPDGYTLLMVGTSNTVNPALYDKLNFNFIRDIAPVGGVIRAPFVLVVDPSMPVGTVPEFISYTKANPDKVNMASSGSGAGSHMTGELFKMMAGINLVNVPYRGGAPAVADLVGGQVQVMFDVLSESIEFIRAGRLRPLAVTTAVRSEALPDLPTVGDFLPGYEASAWFGIGAPRDTPAGIIEKLNKEINAGLADPRMKARFADLGATVFMGSPADFGKFMSEEIEKWGKVVKFAGMKPD